MLFNILGSSRNFSNQDYTGKYPYDTFNNLERIVSGYGTEAGVGGFQNFRKAYVNVVAGDQDYNLLNDFIDQQTGSSVSAFITSVSASHIDIRKMWHGEPSPMYRYYDPNSSPNVLSREFNYESYNLETVFYILPIWADVLRAGMLETSDRIRRSNYSWNQVGSNLRIFPKPNIGLKIWIDYSYDMNPLSPDFKVTGIGDPSVTGITSIYNVPMKDIVYEDINPSGRRWIRQMTLGICFETEGRIRRKYSSIPIPNGDIQLDGDQLVTEGAEKQKELIEQLKEDLEETSFEKMMEKEAAQAEQINNQLQYIPPPSSMFILG
jgi:hypothetical protein